jgi:hypothetical protein
MESHEDGWIERALMFGDGANGAATQIRIIAKRTKDTGIVQIHLSAAEGDHGSEVDGSPPSNEAPWIFSIRGLPLVLRALDLPPPIRSRLTCKACRSGPAQPSQERQLSRWARCGMFVI